MKKKKIKVTQEISRQKLRCMIYASYMLGFLASAEEQRTLNNPKNFAEIDKILSLLDNPLLTNKK